MLRLAIYMYNRYAHLCNDRSRIEIPVRARETITSRLEFQIDDVAAPNNNS